MKNTIELKKFLVDFAKNGYATGNEHAWIQEADGSTSIRYKKNGWSVHDNFFGGEPFGGREIVFYDKKPYWIMTYYGKLADSVKNVNAVYAFLRKALLAIPNDFPCRGPKKFTEGKYVYTNSWHGDVDDFSGKETICINGKHIFTTDYFGGYVNKRSGL